MNPNVRKYVIRIAFISLLAASVVLFIDYQNIVQNVPRPFGSLMVLFSIPLFYLLIIIPLYFAAKFNDRILLISYEKPKKILEGILDDDGKYPQIIGISFLISVFVILLIVLMPPESYANALPMENFTSALAATMKIYVQTIQTMFQNGVINIPYGENFNVKILSFFLLSSIGYFYLFFLRQVRKKIRNEEKLTNPKKHRFPGSRSLLIFLYVSAILLLQRIPQLTVSELNNVASWLTTFSILTFSFSTIMIFLEKRVLPRDRKNV